jgi:hypothetical protein
VGLAMSAGAAARADATLPAPTCSSAVDRVPSSAPLAQTSTLPWNPFVAPDRAPYQWIAKLFTEGLGCAPGQASYLAYGAYVDAQGCAPATLREVALRVLTSPEFLARPYGAAERLLILWRIARESEPSARRYARFFDGLTSGSLTWEGALQRILRLPGFGPSAARLCSGQLYGWNAYAPVIDIPTSHTGAFGDGTGADLQKLLDRAQPGDTVWLEQRAVVRVGDGLHIPAGVALRTVGAPVPAKYASMARLVRTSVNRQALVTLASGAILESVWVDGQRSNANVGMDHDSIDVHVLGGHGTVVRDDRIDNTAGWSNLVTDDAGAPDGEPCSDVAIEDNLIDGYSTKFHWHETTGVVDGRVDTGTVQGQLNNVSSGQTGVSSTFGFADGISNQCRDSHISGNALVDDTDVSVVLFGAVGPSPDGSDGQHSVVEDNTVVNAGNSGWASMTVDQLFPATNVRDFSGSTIRNNLVWTSPNAFLLLVAGIGTKPWFGSNTAAGIGTVSYEDNTSGAVRINTQMAIAVTRMSGAVVHGNTLLANLAFSDLCPYGPYIGVDDAAGSSVQQPNGAVTFGDSPFPSDSKGCLTEHF